MYRQEAISSTQKHLPWDLSSVPADADGRIPCGLAEPADRVMAQMLLHEQGATVLPEGTGRQLVIPVKLFAHLNRRPLWDERGTGLIQAAMR